MEATFKQSRKFVPYITNKLLRKKKNIEPEAYALGLSSFLKRLTGFKNITKFTEEELRLVLKNANIGVKSVDLILENLPIKKVKGLFYLADDIPLNRLETLLKEGDLSKLKRLTKSDIKVTRQEINEYRKLVGATPESQLNDLGKLIENNKSTLKRFNLTVDEFKNAPKNVQREVSTAERLGMSIFKNGTKIALTVGIIVIGTGWVLRELEKRKGCFMFRQIGDKVSSCKIINYTCVQTEGLECTNFKYTHYNITLNAMWVAKQTDDMIEKVNLCKSLGIEPNELYNKLPTLLQEKFDIFSEHLSKIMMNPIDICRVSHDGIENGQLNSSRCRMCDPSADPKSPQYIDSNQYGENITFKCIENPTLLDLFSDIYNATGQKLIDFTKSSIKIIKTISIIAIITIILLILLNIFSKIPKKNTSTENKPQNVWKKVNLDS